MKTFSETECLCGMSISEPNIARPGFRKDYRDGEIPIDPIRKDGEERNVILPVQREACTGRICATAR